MSLQPESALQSRYERHLPPLTELPEPPRREAMDTVTVLPDEYLLDSRRALLLRMLRTCWAPALVLLGLWLLLVASYVIGAGPTNWALSLLAASAEPGILRQAMVTYGFSPRSLTLSFVVLPLVATVVSLLPLPLGAMLIARVQPRSYLSEQAFQRAVATRATAPLMAVPLLAILVAVCSALLQGPLPWKALAAGPSAAVAAGLGWTMLAWLLVRRWMSASRLLGVPDVEALTRSATVGPQEGRSAAAQQVLAQDRRHLPPSRERPAAAMIGRTLLVTARSWRTWVIPAALGIAWCIFSGVDAAVLIQRLSVSSFTSDLRTEMPAAFYLIALVVLLVFVPAIGAWPMAAMRLARPERANVRDLRTYRTWADRRRVNPWEEKVVRLVGIGHGAIAIACTALLAVLLVLFEVTPVGTWVWITLDVVVLAPLIGGAGYAAMREGLRDVVYGPAGWYMRRRTPYALVAPEAGTRAERAEDPLVRAEMRRREQSGAEGRSDASGSDDRDRTEHLPPGALPSQIDDDMIARGALPDFGHADAVRPAVPEPRDAENPYPLPDAVDTTSAPHRPK